MRRTHGRDDLIEVRLRRQRVVHERDRGAGRDGRKGHECGRILGEPPPVAAVHPNEQRRAARRRELVDALALARTVTQIRFVRKEGARAIGFRVEALEIRLYVPADRQRRIVLIVELRLRVGAVDDVAQAGGPGRV